MLTELEKLVKRYLDKPWDWGVGGLSRNTSITPEFVEPIVDENKALWKRVEELEADNRKMRKQLEQVEKDANDIRDNLSDDVIQLVGDMIYNK